jgi:hypothetical protein
MLGFGKKKKQESGGEQGTISHGQMAKESLEVIWQTQEESFNELSTELVDNWEVTYQHAGHLMFFLEASAYDADFMAYNMGFVFGMGQAYGQDDKFCYEALHLLIRGYEKTLANYVEQLQLQHNPKSYSELFAGAIEGKVLVESENGSQGLALGLADGKGFVDFQIAASEDYTKLNDQELASKANLNGLRELLKQWKIGCLLNHELVEDMKQV